VRTSENAPSTTLVNKPVQAFPEARSDHTGSRRRDLGLRVLLLLSVFARQMRMPCHNDHHDRSHYHQPDKEREGHHGPAPEGFEEERQRKVRRSVQHEDSSALRAKVRSSPPLVEPFTMPLFGTA
jgi:hypothetical protein